MAKTLDIAGASDATFDVITSNLMFSIHHLMFDIFADESDVKQSGC